MSSKISVNPSSGGLGALDDSYFQTIGGPVPSTDVPETIKRQSGISKIKEIARRSVFKSFKHK